MAKKKPAPLPEPEPVDEEEIDEENEDENEDGESEIYDSIECPICGKRVCTFGGDLYGDSASCEHVILEETLDNFLWNKQGSGDQVFPVSQTGVGRVRQGRS